MSKTKSINGITVTVTQAKTNYLLLAILFLLTIGSIIGVFLLPVLNAMFGTLALVFGLFTFAMVKAIGMDIF